ncbi:MAG: hypothetical protein IKN60_00205 [Bacteroidales bacterium]|nr:hypothetical protein [Bacteroidales bacterium]
MIDFGLIKQHVTARQAAETYGLTVRRSGMARCPFHDDKTPSLKLDERYYCFGCHATGDAIDFTANFFHIGLREAAEKLAADFHLPEAIMSGKTNAPMRTRRAAPTQTAAVRARALGILSRYEALLDAKCLSLAPRVAESEWSPAFTQTMAERDDAAYGISMLTTGTPRQQADYIQTHREVLNHYERELESHRRSRSAGIRESPVRRDESAGADAAG